MVRPVAGNERSALRRTQGAGMLAAGVGQTVAASVLAKAARGGKSGLHRAECQVTPGRREPTASAAESRPPMIRSRTQVRVKGCGKSAPHRW